MEQQTISAPEKPVLDEDTFQQLLAAAYVLQEQNPQPSKTPVPERADPNPSQALSAIAETQELLRSQYVELPAAANLVAERLQKITHATGVAIALVRQGQLEYCAARGSTAELAGAHVPIGSDLSASNLPEAEILQRLQNDSSSNEGLRERGVYALPLQHEGKVAGLVEIRFEDTDGLQEQEIRTCQLMAGLLNEAIARAADLEWKKTLAAERATMLEALDRIKPQLERLTIETSAEAAPASPAAMETAPAADSTAEPASNNTCRQCGHQLGIGELFCGQCGTKRPLEGSPPGDLQSKWASLWRLQESAGKIHSQNLATESPQTSSDAVSSDQTLAGLDKEVVSALEHEIARLAALDGQSNDGLALAEPGISEPETGTLTEALADEPVAEAEAALMAGEGALEAAPGTEGESPAPVVAETQKARWASANKTLQWLRAVETNAANRTWITSHRADLYVAASVILLCLALLTGWNSPAPSHTTPSQPSLTFFERALISLGLAEAPKPAVYEGNPNVQVWVDLHTALYYCPGSDLYGKTEGGKYTTQRDAQLDQFEPAANKSCD